MNKTEFIKLLAEKASSSAVEADKWFKIITETIGDAVQKTDDLRFVGFGSFKSKVSKAMKVKTPRGDMVDVPERRVVKFSVGAKLKEKALTKIESTTSDDKRTNVKKSSTKTPKASKSKKQIQVIDFIY